VPLPDFLGAPTDLSPGEESEQQAIGSGAATANPLPLAMQPQLQTEWCWAAVAASIGTFYQDAQPKQQCELATELLFTPCCIDPLPPPPPPAWQGNAPYALDGALKLIKHLNGDLVAQPLSFEQVVAEIDAGSPVCCHIEWVDAAGLRGHFNAIVGYDRQTQDVIVRDPYAPYGESTLPYETFKSNYHGGAWDQTYKTH
jgi:hypothetical protein